MTERGCAADNCVSSLKSGSWNAEQSVGKSVDSALEQTQTRQDICGVMPRGFSRFSGFVFGRLGNIGIAGKETTAQLDQA